MIAGLPILIGLVLVSMAWLAGALPRLLGEIGEGRDQRAAGVSAPIWKRLALRVAVWGGALSLVAAGTAWFCDWPLLGLTLAGLSLGAMLGLASSLELLALGAAGSTGDELGASLVGGLLAAFSLAALRLQLRYGASLLQGKDVSSAWTDTLGEVTEILLVRVNSPIEALTHPIALASVGVAFGLALAARVVTPLDTTGKGVALLVAGGLLVGLLVKEVGACGFVAFTLPMGLGCMAALALCARLERWRWAPPPLGVED